MKKIFFVLLSVALMFGIAQAAEQSTSYSRTLTKHTFAEHSQYEYYYNNSGSAITSGSVVAFDVTGAGVTGQDSSIIGNASRNVIPVSETTNATLGWYITTTTTANSALVAGVVDEDSCAASSFCRVQTYGPRPVLIANSTSAITRGNAVGTSTVAGQAGNGNGLGVALETPAGGANDSSIAWIWITAGANR